MSQHVQSLMKTEVHDLGLMEYGEVYERQKACVKRLLKEEVQTLILCEHPTVITLGRLANKDNVLISPENLFSQGIFMYVIDRGGDVTLHAPGQVVVYPIFDLNHYQKDLHWYLYKLEQVVIDLLKDFGIVANRFSQRTGVWMKDEKIASIGIGVRKWVSFHGLAINVNTDLDNFSMIRSCGFDVTMTSMAKILGQAVSTDKVKENIIKHFVAHFCLHDYLKSLEQG